MPWYLDNRQFWTSSSLAVPVQILGKRGVKELHSQQETGTYGEHF